MSQVATRPKSPSVFTPLLVPNSFPCYGASIYQLNAQNMLFSTRSDRNNLLALKQVVNIKTVLIMHQIHRLVRRFNFGGLTTPARFFFPSRSDVRNFTTSQQSLETLTCELALLGGTVPQTNALHGGGTVLLLSFRGLSRVVFVPRDLRNARGDGGFLIPIETFPHLFKCISFFLCKFNCDFSTWSPLARRKATHS